MIFRLICLTLCVGLACVKGQEPRLEFEVASVRVSERAWTPTLNPCATPTCPGGRSAVQGGPGSEDPERITYTGVLMASLIIWALGVNLDHVSGPKWLYEIVTGDRYDIVAKVHPGATKSDVNEMLRNLLIERFGLAYHTERRDLDGYTLRVAAGGAKLRPAADADGPPPEHDFRRGDEVDPKGYPVLPPGHHALVGLFGEGVIRFAGRMVTIEEILRSLGAYLRVPRLEDKTGLAGKYDFKLEFALQGLRTTPGTEANASPTGAVSEPAPDLYGAVEKQLGLKLERGKAPVEVIVIDNLNRQPTDN